MTSVLIYKIYIYENKTYKFINWIYFYHIYLSIIIVHDNDYKVDIIGYNLFIFHFINDNLKHIKLLIKYFYTDLLEFLKYNI